MTLGNFIPSDWNYVRLGDISEALIEKAGSNKYETLSISAGIGFVNQANKFGKELSGKQYEKYIVLRKGDFSYNKGNSKKYPQGCIYQLKDRDEAAVPNVFESFRLNKGINDYYEQLFAKINHGVRDDGLLNLKSEDFYSCYVPFPPLPEQQKIAEILSTQDKLIELQEKKIEQLKELKKAYLQKIFPQKGSKYPEIRFKGFTEVWEQCKLDSLCEVITVGIANSATHAYTDNGIVMFRNQNIKENYLDDSDLIYINKEFESRYAGKRLHENDLLIARTGYPGTACVVPKKYEGSQTFTTLIARLKKGINPYYVCQYINSDYGKDYFSSTQIGGGQKNSGAGILEKFPLKFPSDINEQNALSEFFMNFDSLITLHQRKLEQEKQKKKALMQLLLTGKVRCK